MSDPTIPHGTYSGYGTHNCRCDQCRAAGNAYARRRRDARRSAVDIPHGLNGYTNYRCRCAECRAAMSSYYRDLYAAEPEPFLRRGEEWRRKNRVASRQIVQRRRARAAENDARLVTPKDWERLCRRYGNRCAYCGSMATLEQDHIVPIVRGGRHAIGNLLPACRSCNSSKGSKLLIEWLALRLAA